MAQLRRGRSPHWLRWLLVAILAGSVGAGLGLDVWMRGHTPREAQARWQARAGDGDRAAALYFQALQEGPVTVPLVVALLDARAQTGAPVRRAGGRGDRDVIEAFDHGRRHATSSIREHQIEELLARPDLPIDVALLGHYWRGVLARDVGDDEQALVEEAANATPPMPWANHLLARRALSRGDPSEAGRRFEREGLTFGRADDVAKMFTLFEEAGDWDAIGQRLADPRAAALAAPWVHFRYAVEVRAWGDAAKRLFRTAYARRPSLGTVLLAAVSLLAWFVFCLRLGRATERWRVRLPLYALAPVLGALSIAPTDALIAIQESTLHLDQTGDLGRDALYFLFGVGFREEISKLLLFAPLVPLLRWANATKLDVLVTGALVGLGFATVENLDYFQSADLATAMARFLTANFLHMAMTGITAAALWEGAGDPERRAYDASTTFLTVVGLHGAYDLFLSMPGGASFLGMIVFLVLARRFTAEVHEVRGRAGRGPSLLEVFAIGSAVLAGASFVYAAGVVGPRLAAMALLQGILGLAIIAYFFIQELRRL